MIRYVERCETADGWDLACELVPVCSKRFLRASLGYHDSTTVSGPIDLSFTHSDGTTAWGGTPSFPNQYTDMTGQPKLVTLTGTFTVTAGGGPGGDQIVIVKLVNSTATGGTGGGDTALAYLKIWQ